MTTNSDKSSFKEKFDLSNTSIIIHFRKDHQDRVDNLHRIVSYLCKFLNFKELIIINDNSLLDEEMRSFKDNNKIIPLFFENHDHFKKSQCFNIGAKYATGEILCFYDVDVLIEGQYLSLAQEQILNGAFDHIYPFTGYFVNIKKSAFEHVLPTYNFDFLLEKLPKYDLSWTTDYLEPASNESPGGCNLISRKAFKKIGGYDERFIGWGYEDTDFLIRSRNSNKVAYLTEKNAICWHLSHDNAIRLENPHYNNNIKVFNENRLYTT
jgi:predicted glycosyltransferase involved in capsule biosynthesis